MVGVVSKTVAGLGIFGGEVRRFSDEVLTRRYGLGLVNQRQNHVGSAGKAFGRIVDCQPRMLRHARKANEQAAKRALKSGPRPHRSAISEVEWAVEFVQTDRHDRSPPQGRRQPTRAGGDRKVQPASGQPSEHAAPTTQAPRQREATFVSEGQEINLGRWATPAAIAIAWVALLPGDPNRPSTELAHPSPPFSAPAVSAPSSGALGAVTSTGPHPVAIRNGHAHFRKNRLELKHPG